MRVIRADNAVCVPHSYTIRPRGATSDRGGRRVKVSSHETVARRPQWRQPDRAAQQAESPRIPGALRCCWRAICATPTHHPSFSSLPHQTPEAAVRPPEGEHCGCSAGARLCERRRGKGARLWERPARVKCRRRGRNKPPTARSSARGFVFEGRGAGGTVRFPLQSRVEFPSRWMRQPRFPDRYAVCSTDAGMSSIRDSRERCGSARTRRGNSTLFAGLLACCHTELLACLLVAFQREVSLNARFPQEGSGLGITIPARACSFGSVLAEDPAVANRVWLLVEWLRLK